MISWNVGRGLLAPDISSVNLQRLIRISILVLGAIAAVIALRVQSVQKLWFFTSDLVFVILFPQLVYALFDPRANRTGSIAAFVVSLALRLGGGEAMLGIPPLVSYGELFDPVLPGTADLWLDENGHATLFPIRTVAGLVGLVLLGVVSRLTGRWDPPRPIPTPPQAAKPADEP
jgi:high affinity choline transporter 7